MKSISKLLISLTFILLIGSSAIAQSPSFIVDWNPCELQVTNSNYFVTYAIYNTTTQSFEVPETPYPFPIPYTNPYFSIPIAGFNCDQNDTKPYYYLFLKVVLKDQYGNPYCEGEGRSSLLKCSELYGDATTITVNMVCL